MIWSQSSSVVRLSRGLWIFLAGMQISTQHLKLVLDAWLATARKQQRVVFLFGEYIQGWNIQRHLKIDIALPEHRGALRQPAGRLTAADTVCSLNCY